MTLALWLVAAAAVVPAVLRWIRVAQREHYAAGRVIRFAVLWWSTAPNPPLLAAAAVSALASAVVPAMGMVGAIVVAAGPAGLGVRGVSSPLAWTPRLRRLALAHVVALGSLLAAGAWGGAPLPTALAVGLLVPVFSDLMLAALAPVERRLSRVWVAKARDLLERISPQVVAITGSYGKTTTKTYAAQLLAPQARLVASPASFNNELGLARTINEHLSPGTEILLVEMGTYGPGEIAAMVGWIKPKVAVITSIGPVHLERFGSMERIVSAKAEILSGAETAVLGIDSPELASLAGDVRCTVIRCSAHDETADVYVGAQDGRVIVRGEELAVLPSPPDFAANLACAIGCAVASTVPVEASALAALQAPPHRRQRLVGSSGYEIIDDTYNSNPAGAAAALELVRGRVGRTVVVTPGMVELGGLQKRANEDFARAAAAAVSDLVIVGRTNRRALQEGADEGPATVMLVRSRKEAVEWARRSLGPGDVVLFENDLPDHYP